MVNGNDVTWKWVGRSLAAVLIGVMVSFTAYAGKEIVEIKTNYSKKEECRENKRALHGEIVDVKQDLLKENKEIKEAINDLRKEQRLLIKAVYRSLNK